MAEEKKEKWLVLMPFTTVIFAVCATLSTSKGGGFSNKAVLRRTDASDQWAYFQAKSVKSYLSETHKENLEVQLEAQKDPAIAADIKKRIDAQANKVKAYSAEKEDIKKKAEDLELQQGEAKKHSVAFGLAVLFLQISILLSSIGA